MPSLRSRTIPALVAIFTLAGCTVQHHIEPPGAVTVTRASYGRLPDGRTVELFTLRNAHGVEVRAMTYGAIITVVRTPDRAGNRDDIALGFDSLAGYLGEHP